MEYEDLIKWFFSLVGYFNRYAFFTRKLWRDVEGFEKEDEANIKNALNAHHFDFRGLIEKSLALEAPEYMYMHLKT